MPASLTGDPEILRVVITLAVTGAMLAIASPRLLMVPLVLQYVLVATLLRGGPGDPIFIIRIALGAAISTIVYITGSHVESARAASEAGAFPRGVGRGFRLVALAWAVLVAFGLWSAYPLGTIPGSLALSAYVLIAVGATLALIGADPLRMGVGVLLLLSGFEGVYLTLETGLVALALLGIVEILVALAVSYGTESWLTAIAGVGER
jgi:hypothetical protein